ncbi:MAG: ABC transporter ATP-binding protein [bacterium]|nr:ABC transporter ATP-binding protein [bacterium]
MQVHTEIIRLILRHKLQLFFGILMMLGFALFSVAPAKYMKEIVDGLDSGEVPQLSKFLWVGLGIVLLFVFKGLTFFGQNYLMNSLGLKMIRDLRDQLFDKIVKMPLSYFNRQSTGDLISRFTTDLNIMNEAVNTAISGPLRDFPQIVLLLWLMWVRSWQLSLLTFLLIPFAYLAIRKFGRQNNQVTTKRLQKFSDLTTLLSEAITGIRVVKAFNMEGYELQRFEKENQRLFKYFLHSIRIDSYSYPILELMGGICGAFILTYGGYLIIHGQITGGDFASFLISFFMLYEPAKKFNGFNLKIQEGLSASARIFETLNEKDQIEELPNAKPLEPLKDSVQIDISAFGYGDQTVLADIHLTLPKGSITALVGSSGSGKSTLANLLPRFYDLKPEQGRILIDGVDVREVTLKSLRQQIAVITQEIVLFNERIRKNIAYGKRGAELGEVVAASKAGHAFEFIDRLPKKFDEEVGERGMRFSGGQRQRLSISRALIKDASILIMDEATSALDTESEKEVQLAIDALMQDRTSLIIAHRLSTIQHADVIHVLHEGRIVESGSHAELITQGGEYQRLYEMQFTEDRPPVDSEAS